MRSIKKFFYGIYLLPLVFIYFSRSFLYFKNPFFILFKYIFPKNTNIKKIQLKNNSFLNLSNDFNDWITIFIIFCRQDYGNEFYGKNILDIGGNIGVFSVFAAFCGATGITVFEPCEESYMVLKKNLTFYSGKTKIQTLQALVTGNKDGFAEYNRFSNVRNSHNTKCSEKTMVPYIRLDKIVENLNSPLLCKCDCEGNEYNIFEHCSDKTLLKINEIRLEYHFGPIQKLLTRLFKLGFVCRYHKKTGLNEGIIWLVQKA